MSRFCAALLALLVLSCAASRTEVIVVTDSDMGVPGELDQVEIVVLSPEGVRQSATATLGGTDAPLPRTLGLLHETGPLGPFEVTVTGRQGGSTAVVREAEFTFQPGRTLRLELDLLQECVGMGCPGDQTCAAGGCRERQVSADELTEWDGSGGGECSDEQCNGRDDDCDGNVDEGFDTDSDMMNCGACGSVCDGSNGSASCDGGMCALTCDSGFDDCNGDASDGCEADLTDDETCGTCGTSCRGRDMCCPDGCQRSC